MIVVADLVVLMVLVLVVVFAVLFVCERLLLGSSSYLAFVIIDFQYAFLVGLLTGLSVLIPFLGLAAVTVPVVVLGVFQWGLVWESINPLIVYSILQLIDGNVLAPMILGGTVKVHPTTIMLAVHCCLGLLFLSHCPSSC